MTSKPRYVPFVDCLADIPEETTRSLNQPVNVYTTITPPSVIPVEEDTFLEKIYKCCLCSCCKIGSDEMDSPLNNPTSALTGRIGNSYDLTKDSPQRIEGLPTLVSSRALDTDFSKSTVKLHDENEYSGAVSRDSKDTSRCGTLKSGEKCSFISEVLNYDVFLRSLEWFDNSLTRRKRNRMVTCDQWVRYENEGIELRLYKSIRLRICLLTHDLLVSVRVHAKSNEKTYRFTVDQTTPSTVKLNVLCSVLDEVYMSEGLSPGHATLPRRSSSPIPHDADRDRFSFNKSGLQVIRQKYLPRNPCMFSFNRVRCHNILQTSPRLRRRAAGAAAAIVSPSSAIVRVATYPTLERTIL
ncbi:hypothetical protein EVAR_21222_1 [Eumeta japonica]|uniref:Uncharacterized protein n=1 Tax=Eumeta variegata TaxID=151549 RepID=A0A4C1UPF6_EUMVA|nr:hypothetical protein EVAR_21222_1 [Eumeta japonica]